MIDQAVKIQLNKYELTYRNWQVPNEETKYNYVGKILSPVHIKNNSSHSKLKKVYL